ncbi:hypothetical protein [Kaarinaea lacus]
MKRSRARWLLLIVLIVGIGIAFLPRLIKRLRQAPILSVET